MGYSRTNTGVNVDGGAGKVAAVTGFLYRAGRQLNAQEKVIRGCYLFLLVVSDLLMQGVAYRLSYWIRFELKVTIAPEVVPSLTFYFQLTFLVAFGSIFLFALAGLYDIRNLLGGTQEYARAFKACSIPPVFVAASTFLFPSLFISRLWLLTAWLLSVFFILLGRFVLRRAVYAIRARGFFLVNAAVLGRSAASLELVKELREPKAGYRIRGLVDVEGGKSYFPTAPDQKVPPVLGSLDELEDLVRNYGIRELVVPASSIPRENLFELYARVHAIEGLELRLSTELFELLTTGVEVRTAGVVPLISLKKARLDPMEAALKTVAEYALTIGGLLAISPLFLTIGILIKLDSPGPVFYRRRVIGVAGREFDAFKFRTMRIDGDRILAGNPELQRQLKTEEKLKDDPRITRLGLWLRKYSLDELPQLFNVLLGQMSLVGPRMISPPEAAKYGLNRFNLMTVKPGMTGLWQVSGRSDLTYDERVRLDMYYIRNYSLWLDFHILFVKTVMAVLQGRGAY